MLSEAEKHHIDHCTQPCTQTCCVCVEDPASTDVLVGSSASLSTGVVRNLLLHLSLLLPLKQQHSLYTQVYTKQQA